MSIANRVRVAACGCEPWDGRLCGTALALFDRYQAGTIVERRPAREDFVDHVRAAVEAVRS